ncbi:MAG: substrate-binding domain-containing protein [Phycisphaerales bacterium]|nr:substrate-binding domain-containing protein [Phycisphaerales bacterium]
MIAQMCRQRGWRVPHDVAITAEKNEESLCEHPRPSLTSVEWGSITSATKQHGHWTD